MRTAIARVSRQLVEDVLGEKYDGCTMCVACILGLRKEDLHAALKLPENARVDAVAYDFYTDQVLLRIECPDFREVAEGETLPEVEAMYRRQENAEGDDRFPCVFDGWQGDALPPNNVQALLGPCPSATSMLKEGVDYKLVSDGGQTRPVLSRDALAAGIGEVLKEEGQKPAPVIGKKRNYWEAE